MKNTSRRRRRSNKINSCDYLRLENRQLLATLTVTTFNDVIDPHDGLLSLREAVIEANTNDQDDLIELDSGTYVLSRNYVLTHGGLGEDLAATGDLDVTTDDGHSLYVLGAKTGQTTIDAKRIDRVFQVHPHSNVKLQDITITGGATHEPMIMGRRGAGIWSAHSTLELLNVNLDGNQTGEKGVGGGLWIAGGDFSISNSFFMSNGSGGQGSGMFVRDASGEITLSNFRENMIDEKSSGAIYLQDSRLDLTRSTVDENQGVGIYAFQSELDVFHARFFANKGMEVNKTNGGDKGGDEVLETIGGHAIFADKSDVAVDDSKFVRNASYGIGFFDGDRDSDLHDLTVTGSFFQENGNSGIYYKDGRLLSVADSLFIGKENDTDQFFDDSSTGIRASFYRDQLVPENIDVPNSIFVRNVYAGGEAVYETGFHGNLDARMNAPITEVLTSATPFVTGGRPATLTTLLNHLDTNTVDYQTGDDITLSGSKVDGTSFSISVATDGTTTLGDLLAAIKSQLTDTTVILTADGNMVITANRTGEAFLSVQFEDAAGNSGATGFAQTAIVVETEGKFGDTADRTVRFFDIRGQLQVIKVQFQKTDDNTWDVRFSSADPGVTLVDDVFASLIFREDGTFDSISGNAAGDSNIELAIAGLTPDQTTKPSLDALTHRARRLGLGSSAHLINPQIVDTTPLGEETYVTEIVGNLDARMNAPITEVLTSATPYVTGGSTPVPATLTTLFNDLNSNTVDYKAGDAITLSGSRVDGASFSISVATDGTTTLGDLLAAINSQLTDATATLSENGNMVVKADQTGEALLSIQFEDALANTGATSFAQTALVIETEGKYGDVLDTTIQVFDVRGAPYTLQVSFQKQGFNRWDARFSSADPGVTLVDDVVTAITFAEDGSFQVVAGNGAGDSNIEIEIAGLTAVQTIDVSLDGLRNFGFASSLIGGSEVQSLHDESSVLGKKFKLAAAAYFKNVDAQHVTGAIGQHRIVNELLPQLIANAEQTNDAKTLALVGEIRNFLILNKVVYGGNAMQLGNLETLIIVGGSGSLNGTTVKRAMLMRIGTLNLNSANSGAIEGDVFLSGGTIHIAGTSSFVLRGNLTMTGGRIEAFNGNGVGHRTFKINGNVELIGGVLNAFTNSTGAGHLTFSMGNLYMKGGTIGAFNNSGGSGGRTLSIEDAKISGGTLNAYTSARGSGRRHVDFVNLDLFTGTMKFWQYAWSHQPTFTVIENMTLHGGSFYMPPNVMRAVGGDSS